MSSPKSFTKGDLSASSGGYVYPACPSCGGLQTDTSGLGGPQYSGNACWHEPYRQLGLWLEQQDKEADAIMRDFYRQVDKTDHKIREQDQQVTALEAATVHLLERQASTHKRVQALADGITKQDELQAKQVGKRFVPLQTNLPH